MIIESIKPSNNCKECNMKRVNLYNRKCGSVVENKTKLTVSQHENCGIFPREKYLYP